MPIKKSQLNIHLGNVFFLEKALNTLSEQAENSVQVVPNMVIAKSGYTKYFLENLDYKV